MGIAKPTIESHFTELSPPSTAIPSTLGHAAASRFWTAVAITGILTGLAAGVLTKLLEWVQRSFWGGDGNGILTAAQHVTAWHCVLTLLAAGVITGLGQRVLKRLSSGNDIDTTSAIWFYAGRLQTLRTLGSAVLSVVVVGMGVSLGREGAPKQAGSVFANWASNLVRLSDEQRQLLVACGAGAGMGAAYGVPLGGAVFALEVLRGALALRFVLPALLCSIIATVVAWTMLPNAPTYSLPVYHSSSWCLVFAIVCGCGAGLFSVWFVRLVTWVERQKPSSWQRIVRPMVGMTLLGVIAIRFPQVLGNGKDVSQLLLLGEVPGSLAAVLLLLKPAAILLCIVCGVPGGLFTPSLTSGALFGSVIGYLFSPAFSSVPAGLCAMMGAGAVLAATTQGPISAAVLLMELTGQDRSFVLPLLLTATIATIVARSVEPRSIYDARLNDEQIRTRQELRERVRMGPDLLKE